MKISIVTISYNQARYVERTICSVLEQEYEDLEYIVEDPGSTDGSREIIEKYRNRIDQIIFEPDKGAADGLNKGFACSSGDILGFLNSDDILMPGALRQVAEYFEKHPKVDVVSGHCFFIDSEGKVLRKGFSEPFNLIMVAYGSSIIMQPSTFFRRRAYLKTSGFNPLNRSSWDGELFIDMAINGAKFSTINQFWSGFRLHSQSITSSQKLIALHRNYKEEMFQKILHREKNPLDYFLYPLFRLIKHLRNPRFLWERIIRGPVSGRYK